MFTEVMQILVIDCAEREALSDWLKTILEQFESCDMAIGNRPKNIRLKA